MEILNKVTIRDIFILCKTSNIMNNRICNNDDFWKKRLISLYKDILDQSEIYDLYNSNKWKEKYISVGQLYSFGKNKYGQLGLGDIDNKDKPTKIKCSRSLKGISGIKTKDPFGILSFNNIKAKFISSGGYHSLIIDENNDIYSFGYNKYGQLGLGNNINRNIPEKIPIIDTNIIKVKAISAGKFHSLIIDENNDVYSFGNNKHGQLGLGDNISRFIPIKIEGIKARFILAGYSSSFIITY